MRFYSILGTKYVLYPATVQPAVRHIRTDLRTAQADLLYVFQRPKSAVRHRFRINTKERGNYENRF